MARLTKAHLEFWARWESHEFLCAKCGAGPRSSAYIQPQLQTVMEADGTVLESREPGKPPALCGECVAEINREIRERDRAARPKCEVPGCGRPSTYKVGYAPEVSVCRRCLSKARRILSGRVLALGSLAFLGLGFHVTGKHVIEAAGGAR